MSLLHFKTQKLALNFMSGSNKSLSSSCKLGLFVFCFFAGASFAHTPKPAQIAQHQPKRLSASRQAFKQSGTVTLDSKSYKTELKWYKPGAYDFVVSGLPSSYTGVAGNDGQWVLQRRPGNRCSINIANRLAQCGPAMFWAMLELSAQPEAVGGALIRAGLFSQQDAVFEESHSATTLSPSSKRVKLHIGKNGDKPKAVMRIFGPNSSEGSGEPVYIDFDQNFLVPLHAQFIHQGSSYKIKARTELNIDRDQPRYSHVMASTLWVSRGETNMARFTRSESVVDRALKEESFRDGVISIGSLQESLSGDAGTLLNALLMTH
jgi:hypothetical protein